MGILSSLAKGLNSMIDDYNTPESFKIGDRFEAYVRKFIFTDTYYDILERTHNYTTNKDYVESSLKPDFKFRDRGAKKEFYVEAKFRTTLYNNKIVWTKENQLLRYREFGRQAPVFILLGFGGKPDYPDFLSLIPLAHAKYPGLFPSHVEKFEIDPETAVSSKLLWKI